MLESNPILRQENPTRNAGRTRTSTRLATWSPRMHMQALTHTRTLTHPHPSCHRYTCSTRVRPRVHPCTRVPVPVQVKCNSSNHHSTPSTYYPGSMLPGLLHSGDWLMHFFNFQISRASGLFSSFPLCIVLFRLLLKSEIPLEAHKFYLVNSFHTTFKNGGRRSELTGTTVNPYAAHTRMLSG